MRYAHPWFESETALTATMALAAGLTEEDWKKQNLGPVPAVARDGRMDLREIIGDAGVTEIEDLGEIRFHVLGDSGCGTGEPAERVANDMAADYKPHAGGLNPAFLLHLGDVIYDPDKAHNYTTRFYKPYRHYPGKIIAIPGNHDGEAISSDDKPSLSAFQENFCAEHPMVPQAASMAGIYRETMTQPGVYWVLEAPFVRIIGLYSNWLENTGFLQGKTASGDPDASQLDWLRKQLEAIGKAERKALVMATHHPPYSESGHPPSPAMRRDIQDICDAAKVWPDLFLSAHAHNYQRFTQRANGKQIPYVVAGTGGMKPIEVPKATRQPATGSQHATYDEALASLGYLLVTVSTKQIKTEFRPLGDAHATAFDRLTVDLGQHTITAGG